MSVNKRANGFICRSSERHVILYQLFSEVKLPVKVKEILSRSNLILSL